jgi:hypothetical protein
MIANIRLRTLKNSSSPIPIRLYAAPFCSVVGPRLSRAVRGGTIGGMMFVEAIKQLQLSREPDEAVNGTVSSADAQRPHVEAGRADKQLHG